MISKNSTVSNPPPPPLPYPESNFTKNVPPPPSPHPIVFDGECFVYDISLLHLTYEYMLGPKHEQVYQKMAIGILYMKLSLRSRYINNGLRVKLTALLCLQTYIE